MKITSKFCTSILGAAFLGLLSSSSFGVAFTGAQGFGAVATGGSTTYTVTNLNDSGAGSFRDAVSGSHRYIRFGLSGTIKLKSEVAINSNLTIDGTTAPSPGITITGNTSSFSGHSNVIIRNLRFRETDSGSSGKGSLQGSACNTIMIDHCSIEQGRWDCSEYTSGSHDITVQFCIVGEGIDPQHFGMLFDGADRVSVHHNLFINNESRNPKLKANAQYIDNVIYNWGGGGGLIGGHSSAPWNSDIINNTFIAGPSSGSGSGWIALCTANDVWYVQGNMYDLNRDGVQNPVAIPNSGFTAAGVKLRSTIFNHPTTPVTIDNNTHCINVIKIGGCGASPNDSFDKALVANVMSMGKTGAISTP